MHSADARSWTASMTTHRCVWRFARRSATLEPLVGRAQEEAHPACLLKVRGRVHSTDARSWRASAIILVETAEACGYAGPVYAGIAEFQGEIGTGLRSCGMRTHLMDRAWTTKQRLGGGGRAAWRAAPASAIPMRRAATDPRQADRYRRAFAGCAGNADIPLMLFDNFLHGGEAQAGA